MGKNLKRTNSNLLLKENVSFLSPPSFDKKVLKLIWRESKSKIRPFISKFLNNISWMIEDKLLIFVK
jgi:hypothetical protein